MIVKKKQYPKIVMILALMVLVCSGIFASAYIAQKGLKQLIQADYEKVTPYNLPSEYDNYKTEVKSWHDTRVWLYLEVSNSQVEDFLVQFGFTGIESLKGVHTQEGSEVIEHFHSINWWNIEGLDNWKEGIVYNKQKGKYLVNTYVIIGTLKEDPNITGIYVFQSF